MATRTDIHRPSEINPDDYEFVAHQYIKMEDLGDCLFMQEQREILRAHMSRTGGKYSHHSHGGVCMVCGNAYAIYTEVFYHPKTNTYVITGQDCAFKIGIGDATIFKNFREQVKDALELKSGKAKAKAVLQKENLSEAWDIYTEVMDTGMEVAQYEERTIADIVSKQVKYGSISDRQMDFIRKLIDAIYVERPQREALRKQREEEHANAPDAPDGRVTITGTVVSMKVYESERFGESVKMTVKSDEGWLAWGSIPSGISGNVEKGCRVSFTATVTRSDKDPKFGFYKRPTKGVVLENTLI